MKLRLTRIEDNLKLNAFPFKRVAVLKAPIYTYRRFQQSRRIPPVGRLEHLGHVVQCPALCIMMPLQIRNPAHVVIMYVCRYDNVECLYSPRIAQFIQVMFDEAQRGIRFRALKTRIEQGK